MTCELQRPVGPAQHLFFPASAARHDLEIRYRAGAWRMASDAVGARLSPPPIHDVFAVGEDRLAVLRLAAHPWFCLAAEIHLEMDSPPDSRPGSVDRSDFLLRPAGEHERFVFAPARQASAHSPDVAL